MKEFLKKNLLLIVAVILLVTGAVYVMMAGGKSPDKPKPSESASGSERESETGSAWESAEPGSGTGSESGTGQKLVYVTGGKIPKEIRLMATVKPDQPQSEMNCHENIVIEEAIYGIEFLKKQGDTFLADEPLYRLNGKEYTAGFRGKITSSVQYRYATDGGYRKAVVEVLNYDKMYLSVDLKELDGVLCGEPFYVRVEGLDYRIESDEREIIYGGEDYNPVEERIYLPLPIPLAPGTEVSIKTVVLTEKNAEAMAPADMFYQIDGQWAADVKETDGSVSCRKVTLGEEFTDPRDQLKYVVILSGLKRGERLFREE